MARSRSWKACKSASLCSNGLWAKFVYNALNCERNAMYSSGVLLMKRAGHSSLAAATIAPDALMPMSVPKS